MSVLSVLVTVFGTAMAVSNLPQAYKIFKRKSAKDISILTFGTLFIGVFLWILYGIEINNFPLIITNSIGSVGLLSVIVGWYMYGRK
ncbi:MAG: hypothetical protein KJ955_06010 [Nanoarchaeota archaeon]|nr:hypothetical protein [Nanoarchaeota archaeon]